MNNKQFVRKEVMSKIVFVNGGHCYLIQEGIDFGDGLGLYDHIGYDYIGNPTRKSKKTVLDANFNMFIEFVGNDSKKVETLMKKYKAKGLDVFIGEGAPISRSPKLVWGENKFRATEKAIWARPTEAQLEHYQSLLKNNKTKKNSLKK